MRYYPIFMDLAGRPCLVVGAGAVAVRKARALLDCGAAVTVVGVAPDSACRALERRGAALRRRRFRTSDVLRRALVIAATDDRAVNAAVSAACRRRNIPVNVVDDPDHCTFIVPALVRRGDIAIAISTGGKSPAAARLIKERVAEAVGKEYADLVRLFGSNRRRMMATVVGPTARAQTWKKILDRGILEALRDGKPGQARRILSRCLAEATPVRARRAAFVISRRSLASSRRKPGVRKNAGFRPSPE